jgi:hypothetical protein
MPGHPPRSLQRPVAPTDGSLIENLNKLGCGCGRPGADRASDHGLQAPAFEASAENRGPHVARLDEQARVRDQNSCPLAAPCRLDDENSRAKIQNVCGDSSAAALDGAFHGRYRLVPGTGRPRPDSRYTANVPSQWLPS